MKDVLVLKCKKRVTDKELEEIRKKIEGEMKNGLILLPDYIDAKICHLPYDIEEIRYIFDDK